MKTNTVFIPNSVLVADYLCEINCRKSLYSYNFSLAWTLRRYQDLFRADQALHCSGWKFSFIYPRSQTCIFDAVYPTDLPRMHWDGRWPTDHVILRRVYKTTVVCLAEGVLGDSSAVVTPDWTMTRLSTRASSLHSGNKTIVNIKLLPQSQELRDAYI